MATFTKHQLVSDIILRVTKGKPSDDLELEPSQVEFWINIYLPMLIKASLEEKLATNQDIDSSYITIEECVAPKIKDKSCKDCQDNVYVDLCKLPMNLSRDKGVLRVVTEDGQWVDKMSIFEIDNLRHLKFSKPSITNIKYHRIKKRLYFYGLTEDTLHLVNFNIAYVPFYDLESMSDSDQISVGDDILPILAEQVEAIARRQIYQSDIDEENNGKQDLNINN